MYEYKVKVLKVIDGDTVDVDIDLGFGIIMKNQRVRIAGIDTPESRTADPVEKLFGNVAKNKLKEILGDESILKTQKNKNDEDSREKFGRILGDFVSSNGDMVSKILINGGYCVEYFGGNKYELIQKHNQNRKRLVEENEIIKKEFEDLQQKIFLTEDT